MKKLLDKQTDYLHARASEMDSELFISEIKSDLLYGIQGNHQSERKNANKNVRLRKLKHARKNKPLI